MPTLKEKIAHFLSDEQGPKREFITAGTFAATVVAAYFCGKARATGHTIVYTETATVPGAKVRTRY
jgi:hypothetical protein